MMFKAVKENEWIPLCKYVLDSVEYIVMARLDMETGGVEFKNVTNWPDIKIDCRPKKSIVYPSFGNKYNYHVNPYIYMGA